LNEISIHEGISKVLIIPIPSNTLVKIDGHPFDPIPLIKVFFSYTLATSKPLHLSFSSPENFSNYHLWWR
jgi:hypothetical protein